MEDTWTGNGVYWHSWNNSNTYTGNQIHVDRSKQETIYQNGQKLRPGEQRPNPFWIKYGNKILLIYFIISYSKFMLRFRICGAYSRHYDKPRKFRKKRLF